MAKSVHDKLAKVRKPRVHISYDVETEDASQKKELPFVVGVMGDFSGDNKSQAPLKDRTFTQVDNETFNEVMERTAPELNLKVENTLKGDGSEMAVNLKFNSMDDFSPENIVNQVEPLKKLMEVREKLNEILSKADRSEELEDTLQKILQNTTELDALAKKLGVKNTDESGQ